MRDGCHVLQATAILTPLLAALTGERPRPTVWAGCAVALASTCLITLDGSEATGHAAGAAGLLSLGEPSLASCRLSRKRNSCPWHALHQLCDYPAGDAAVLGAAFFYSGEPCRVPLLVLVPLGNETIIWNAGAKIHCTSKTSLAVASRTVVLHRILL